MCETDGSWQCPAGDTQKVCEETPDTDIQKIAGSNYYSSRRYVNTAGKSLLHCGKGYNIKHNNDKACATCKSDVVLQTSNFVMTIKLK